MNLFCSIKRTFSFDNFVVQRFKRISSVTNRNKKGPDSVHCCSEKVVSDAERGEDRGEEHEEDDDGGPPAQEAEQECQTNSSEGDGEEEEDDTKTNLPCRLDRHARLQLVELQHGEEEGGEADDDAGHLGQPEHVALLTAEVSTKDLEKYFTFIASKNIFLYFIIIFCSCKQKYFILPSCFE